MYPLSFNSSIIANVKITEKSINIKTDTKLELKQLIVSGGHKKLKKLKSWSNILGKNAFINIIKKYPSINVHMPSNLCKAFVEKLSKNLQINLIIINLQQ